MSKESVKSSSKSSSKDAVKKASDNSKKSMWGGRFKQELDDDAKKLSYSFSFDNRLFWYDIQTNKAYVNALLKAEVLSDAESKKLRDALQGLIDNVGELTFDYGAYEDVHSFVEAQVVEKCGDLGKKMHTGKSRNDQVMTDVRLFLKDEMLDIITELEKLLQEIYKLADKYKTLVFPGMTHFQPAQPVLLGHHFLAYFEMFSRDMQRFQFDYDMTDVCPLGSGAVAGNNYNLDREAIATDLGFQRVSTNSMDAVADRDFMLGFFSSVNICMLHLSRFCEELILWSSPFVGFVTLSDDFTTGSSLMPQKKNPDIAELIRGKTGRVLGDYTGLSQALKALPLTYNRDLQEDKEFLFDAVDTMKTSLTCFTKMIANMQINRDVIKRSMKKGHILATDLADYLVSKGVSFRDSHEQTGKIVMYAVEKNKQLADLELKEMQRFSDHVEKDVYDALKLESSIRAKSGYGGTALAQVTDQLKSIKEAFEW